MTEAGINYKNPILEVFHHKLKNVNEDSDYQKCCPVCEGMLLVRRHPQTFALLRHDNCILCGQRVLYLDEKIGVEPLT